MVELDFCLYAGLTDRTPKQMSATWPELAERLTEFDERIGKEGPLWSPSLIAKGETRSNANVVSVSCLVLDFDDGHDWSDFEGHWSGLEYVLHTTHQHTAAAPRWRAVFPLAEPVHGLDWPAIYRKLVTHLACGVCDPSCKDASRMYYLPSCGIGAERFSKHQQGRTLDPGQYPDVPEEDQMITDVSPAEVSGDRPGDDFETSATFGEILIPKGWTKAPSFDSRDRWIRPGKRKYDGISAISGPCQLGERFWCFSSSDPLVKPNRQYTKFSLYAALYHNSDYKAAAKDLARKGYGKQTKSQVLTADIDEDGEDSGYSPEYPRTDVGNAERFVDQHGARLRYCHKFGRWLVWNGRFWDMDQTGGAPVYQMAIETVRNMRVEAAEMPRGQDRTYLWQWAGKCEARSKLENMIGLAKMARGIPVTPEEMDLDRDTLVCANGTFYFNSSEFHEGHFDPSALATKGLEIAYNPNADCPLWEKFLETAIPDEDVRDYVWKAAGYTLTGSTDEQTFFFLYGPGGNGKSTFMEVVMAVMGRYAVKTPTESFIVRKSDRGPRNDIARLQGARLVVASEMAEGSRLDEQLIKDITGKDKLTARFLNQEFFDFRFDGKVWMFGNHKPGIRGTDTGIWRRPALIPFTTVVPEEQRVKDLMDQIIAAELPGVLNWMIEGYKLYRATGLEKPQAVLAALEDYRVEQDVIGSFLAECTVSKPYASVPAAKMYLAYKQWSEANGEYVKSNARFGKELKERGVKSHRTSAGQVYDDLEVFGGNSVGFV